MIILFHKKIIIYSLFAIGFKYYLMGLNVIYIQRLFYAKKKKNLLFCSQWKKVVTGNVISLC